MPKISVLVPIFNVEQYLEECLDSLVHQTLEDIEIICINDGSTDSSPAIIKRFAKADPRIVTITKKNSGYGDSMNKGLKKATGEYIAIVESDDWIEKDAFEKLYALAKEHDAEVVKSNYFDYFTTPDKKHLSGVIVELVPNGKLHQLIDPRKDHEIFYQKPAIWTGIYKNDFLRDHSIQFLPSPGASYQDMGFNFKVWSSARKAVFTNQAFLHYRQDNEASSVNNPGKVFCIADEFHEIEDFLKKNDLYETLGSLMRIAKWASYSWNIERLKAELSKDFILKASEEYKLDLESGVFNYELCGPNQVRSISELITSPETVIARKYATESARVAVIIPCYNVERFVEKSIESALSQTLKEIEIILVDDGSTDDTAAILDTYFAKDVRIKVVNTTNGGLSAARNVGISESTAPYIAFLDSDDYYEPNSIENLLTNLEENSSDVSVGSIRVIYNDKRLTAVEKNNDKQYYTVKLSGKKAINGTVLKKTDVSSCNKLFKRSIIERNNIHYPYGLKYEDAFFFNTYCMVADTISYLPGDVFVYNYVRRSDSIMSETFSKKSSASIDHLEIAIGIFDFMVENKLVESWGDYFLDIFKEYLEFALRYSPDIQHHRIFKRATDFAHYNKSIIDTISDTAFDQVVSLSRQSTALSVVSAKEKIKLKIKKHLRPALSKTSLSYRAQGHIMNSLTSMHHKIDRLEQENAILEKHLSRISQELEKVTRQNK